MTSLMCIQVTLYFSYKFMYDVELLGMRVIGAEEV